MLPIKTSTSFILLFLVCFSTNNALSQILEGNSYRFYITAEDENEIFQVCGLTRGKQYDVFFNGDELNSVSAQKITVEAISPCSSFPIPFIGEGKVSVVCNDCPQQSVATNSFMDSPIYTFINGEAEDLANNGLFGGKIAEKYPLKM